MRVKEKWKWVRGYEGLYKVSNMGRIKTLRRANSLKDIKEQIMKPCLTVGYEYIQLTDDKGKTKKHRVHRLVLSAFKPRENEIYLQVNHQDGCKTNNRLSNLEWCTRSENMKHAFKLGLASNKGPRLERRKKLLQLDLETNKVIKTWDYVVDAAKFFGCSESAIRQCAQGVIKSSNGFNWEYENNIELKRCESET